MSHQPVIWKATGHKQGSFINFKKKDPAHCGRYIWGSNLLLRTVFSGLLEGRRRATGGLGFSGGEEDSEVMMK